jgi:hypothetical protein
LPRHGAVRSHKGDPFFEQLKADVLEGFASAERGLCVTAEESTAGDDPTNDDASSACR